MRTITVTPVKNLARRTTLLAVLALAITGCASVPTPVSVADTIAANPSLSTLNGLVAQAGLTDTLRGAGPFTVFAPTNDAFKAVSAKTMESLGKDPAALKAVLTYHVLPVKAMSADVKNGKFTTLNGAALELSKAGDFVTAENAMVSNADIAASNGVVHIVDTVLMPPVKK